MFPMAGGIYCNSLRSCKGADIRSNGMWIEGELGAECAVIRTSGIMAEGKNALKNAIIRPLNHTLAISMFGHMVGEHSQILCLEDGDDCFIHCAGNACQGAKFICGPGATCRITNNEDCQPMAYADLLQVDYTQYKKKLGKGQKPTRAPKPTKGPRPTRGGKGYKRSKTAKPTTSVPTTTLPTTAMPTTAMPTTAMPPTAMPTTAMPTTATPTTATPTTSAPTTATPTTAMPTEMPTTAMPTYGPQTYPVCPFWVNDATEAAPISPKCNDQTSDEHLRNLLAGHGNGPCSDAHSCNGATIDTWPVEIDGYYACVGCTLIGASEHSGQTYAGCRGESSCSSAVSITADKILCESVNSCNGASVISGDEHVDCLGTMSCARVQDLDAGELFCEGLESCIDSIIDANNVYCNAYSSCKGATINAASTLKCTSGASCMSGTYSADTIFCDSWEGCKDSTLSGSLVILHGWTVAKGATLFNVDRIEAYGGVSLTGANIGGDQDFDVFCYGSASCLGGVITCSSGTTCTLHCYANGCAGTQFICNAGSTCSLFTGYDELQECPADNSVQITSDNTACPIFTDYNNVVLPMQQMELLNNAQIVNAFEETVMGMKSEFVIYGAAVIGVLLSVIAAIYYYQTADKYAKYTPLAD